MTCHCATCRRRQWAGVACLALALLLAVYLTGCSLAASNAGTSVGIDLPMGAPPSTVPKLPQGHPIPTWARP